MPRGGDYSLSSFLFFNFLSLTFCAHYSTHLDMHTHTT